MDEIKAKQQVVEKIKEAGKILVTVSDDPSVDALSAALALTLLLDKQEKYATAIFSGETPPAIAFLEPQKTFDDTTDSLRDFIIALNKEKADHLRYKVEGDSVKIFITPYKTTINQDDLNFSQGDYNVELVIALGVDKQENLDKALENHGQILHDAAIVTLSSGDQTSDLGGVDWHDANASSLSEMVAGLAEALKDDKKKSLLDTPIATALLTGIVAETDRFSNEHTTSKVMTVAATLMAAGADQQLIANELQQAQLVVESEPEDDNSGSSDDTSGDDSEQNASSDDQGVISIKKDPSSLSIAHDGETLAEMDKRVLGQEAAQEKIEDEIEAIEHQAEEEADKRQKAAIAESTPKLENSQTAVHAYAPDDDEIDEPTFGGVLNATTDQAEDDARRAIEQDQNKTILSHSYIGDASGATNASSLASEPAGFPGTPDTAPGSTGFSEVASNEPVHSAYAFEEPSSTSSDEPKLAVGSERVIQPLTHSEPVSPLSEYVPEIPAVEPASAYALDSEPAPASVPPAPEPTPVAPPVIEPAPAPEPYVAPPVDSAYAAPQPVVEPAPVASPAPPVDLGLPLPPPIPDFSQGLSAAIPTGQTQPGILGDILAPEPSAPLDQPTSLGLDYEATNSIPTPGSAYAPVEEPPVQAEPVSATEIAPALAPPPSAPGQFQIPGQQ